MIFSFKKWDEADEIRKFIPVSSGLSFENMESSLNDAFNLFYRPLFGDELSERVIAIYESESPSEQGKKILEESQRAVANLAFWFNYSELSLRITDMGIQRQESETFKQTYKYQEDDLKTSFKNKGFNALDRIICLFEKHAEEFPEFMESPAFSEVSKTIVSSTSEVNSIYFINSSRLIFLRLKPLFKVVEDTILVQLMGQDLHRKFTECLSSGTKEIGSTTTEELRRRCAVVVVNHAVAMLIKQTGSLTDRGLYFEQTVAGKSGNTEQSPASRTFTMQHAATLEATAGMYADALTNFIRNSLPDFYKGKPSDVFMRDNDNKRTFWA